jgi:hypothetical protein
MTHFPAEVFSLILDFCNEKIETKQKRLWDSIKVENKYVCRVKYPYEYDDTTEKLHNYDDFERCYLSVCIIESLKNIRHHIRYPDYIGDVFGESVTDKIYPYTIDEGTQNSERDEKARRLNVQNYFIETCRVGETHKY